jgi:hypothetical protein
VLLRSLPFPEPERLVRIFFDNPAAGMHGMLYSVPELEDLRHRAGIFEYVTGAERGSIDMTGGSKAERLDAYASIAVNLGRWRVCGSVGGLGGVIAEMGKSAVGVGRT